MLICWSGVEFYKMRKLIHHNDCLQVMPIFSSLDLKTQRELESESRWVMARSDAAAFERSRKQKTKQWKAIWEGGYGLRNVQLWVTCVNANDLLSCLEESLNWFFFLFLLVLFFAILDGLLSQEKTIWQPVCTWSDSLFHSSLDDLLFKNFLCLQGGSKT